MGLVTFRLMAIARPVKSHVVTRGWSYLNEENLCWKKVRACPVCLVLINSRNSIESKEHCTI